jgi:hypothetical protein
MRMAKFALTMVFAVAGLVLLADQRVAANEGIPLEALAGNYSSTCQGTLAICLDPMTFAPANCATGSPAVLPLTDLDVGALTRDDEGNACSTGLGVDASLSVGKNPPSVSKVHPAVAKTLNYDPATGTGDISVAEYRGGKCIGSTFDGTGGAKETATFIFHFAASNGGKRIDMIVTSATAFVTDTTGNFFGGFSLSCTNLRQ